MSRRWVMQYGLLFLTLATPALFAQEAFEDEPDPTAFVVLEKDPQCLNCEEIRKRIGYPPLAKEAGIQGKVIVRLLIDQNGQYRRHIVLRSPHKLLTEAVERELPSLEFSPGIQAERPVSVWVTLAFDFRPNEP